MDEIKELYQQIILDHNKNPKNYGELENYNHTSEGYNPLCGDRLNVYLQIEDDKIRDIHFVGSGCAISKASASVMTTVLKGKTIAEAREIFKKFQELITSNSGVQPDFDKYGKLAVFAGVREFPTRVKCASLGWHTVLAAIEDKDEVVTTES
ncbi:MAG: SUF system NifU family Fe-S cluster assembly protein [Calditrichae bacterium]|nr:SUF system NifU family Fe-S cluster assembly protein [Calditrichia bacterium]